jgi:hypothetical protein
MNRIGISDIGFFEAMIAEDTPRKVSSIVTLGFSNSIYGRRLPDGRKKYLGCLSKESHINQSPDHCKLMLIPDKVIQ